eukprot:12895217-Prorocentrum_lima.AAC.1
MGIRETSDIPIILSLPQMQNLRFSLNLKADTVTLTCPSLGYDCEKIQFGNSRRLVVDLTRL